MPDKVNPEIDQDRAFDLFDTYKKHGTVMFHQQKAIYQQIGKQVQNKVVLEAGCGNGVGSAMLSRSASYVCPTDKLGVNINLAQELYPWMSFNIWDINYPYAQTEQVVVAVEVFEHVANPQAAMDNLLAAADEVLWLSTPNGNGKPRPPENPYHVCEYTPAEICFFAKEAHQTEIYNWETFKKIDDLCTLVDPLVYKITKVTK